jgi:hypothetical protein
MATEEEDFADERYDGDDDNGGDDEGVGQEESGEDVEGLSGGRIPNPPPRDPWVSRVVEDPANPPAAVLLSGYVGDAAEEGRTRIYTDPSLASYVEVQDEDVLHHEALGGDQVPEGGSMVWVRADAMVTPGSGGGTGGAAGGDFFTGPVLGENRKAGTGAAAATPVQITLLTIAGCHTRQLGCTIFGCVTHNLLCKTVHPIVCSHVCQQGGGIGHPGGGTGIDLEGTMACPSIGCPSNPVDCHRVPNPGDQGYPVGVPRMAMAQGGLGGTNPRQGVGENVGPTGYFHCGELVGVTGWQGCGQQEQGPIGQTGWQGCGQQDQGPVGITGWQGCGQPHISLPGCLHTGPCPIGVTGWRGCGLPHISLPGCIHTGTCSAIDACPTRICAPGEGTDTVQAAAGGAIGITGWQGCGQPHISLPGCIHTGTCPTRLIGCTGYPGCGPHISLPGCIHTGTCPSAVDACPTRICGGGGGEQVNPQAMLGARPGGGTGNIVGPTGWQGCGQPHISLPGCIHTGTCPIGQTGWLGCGQPHISLPGCIHTGTCSAIDACPTRACAGEGADTVQAAAAGTIGQTGWLGCGQPHISLPGCVHTGTCPIGHTGWLGCGQPHISLPGCVHTGTCPSAVDACPTRICGGGGGEQVNPQAMMAAAPGGQQAAVPTTVYGPQCPTFGFTCTYVHCPPQTLATVCTQAQPGGEQAAAAPTTVYGPQCPTFGFTCTYVHCPPQTVATVCTQIGCQTQQCTLPPGCPPPTGPDRTIATVCTQINCPTFGFTCTAFCQAQGGEQGGGQAQDAGGGGDNTLATVCTQFCHTSPHVCAQHEMKGAAAAAPGITSATVCTQLCHTSDLQCPPHTLDCSIATVCTQIGCHSFGFTCTAFCPQPGGAGGTGQGTAATLCTQIGCETQIPKCPLTIQCIPPSLTPDCGAQRQPQGFAAAAPGGGAQAGAATFALHCPTLGFTCTYIHCPQGGAGGGAGGGLGGAAATFTPNCPTLGFTCTYVHCPQGGGGGGAGGGVGGAMGGGAAAAGPSTVATVCTQLGCPRTSTCPPTFQPGCGPDHEHGGSTAATLCTLTPFCPPSVICPPVTMGGCGGGGGRLGAEAPQTLMLGCPSTSTCTPQTLMPGCPQTSTCTPQTKMLGCPQTSTCTPQTLMLGCPQTSTCTPQTLMLGCPQTSTCTPQTRMIGCPNTSTCTPQTLMLGCPSTSTCPPA